MESRDTNRYRSVVTVTDQIRILRILLTGKVYSSEKWAIFSKPMNAQGEMTAIRTICPKEDDPSMYSGS